jgi:hypothetical protein
MVDVVPVPDDPPAAADHQFPDAVRTDSGFQKLDGGREAFGIQTFITRRDNRPRCGGEVHDGFGGNC